MPAQITNDSQTHTFISLRGQPQPLGVIVEPITRPGVSGTAYQELGEHAPPFEMVGIRDYDSAAAAADDLEAMKTGLQGTVCSVTDDHGVTWTQVMVLDVQMLERRKITGAVGGLSSSKGALLVVRLTLQICAAPDASGSGSGSQPP